jgi:hypothetical protein
MRPAGKLSLLVAGVAVLMLADAIFLAPALFLRY